MVRGARSVAELLPRAFEDLNVDDVRQVVADVGEERESLYFERKRQITPNSLAKSCAAFANTYGGLLLVGIEDETDELIGIDPVGEPQVWVKDVLRGHLIPMPPFRARWLPLNSKAKRGVLVVLVEESSTTPHLLTRSGAIYVRNPGSSDPVPIGDQARLLDLTRRGSHARESAVARADQVIENRYYEFDLYTIALVPTGCSHDPVRLLYSDSKALQALREAVEVQDLAAETAARIAFSEPEWSLGRVALSRQVDRPFFEEPESFLDGISIEADCAIQLQRCLRRRHGGEHPEPRGPRPLEWDEPYGILPWFSEAFRRSRDLALALGAHGDLRVVFDVGAGGRWVVFSGVNSTEAKRQRFRFPYWASLDADTTQDEALTRQFGRDFRRDLGLAPR